MKSKLFLLTVLCSACALASANDDAPQNGLEDLRQQGYSVNTIIPVFSQLVTFSLPKGFVPAFENAKGNMYIHESVPEGESLEKWSQMVTLTGAKGIADNPKLTPMLLAGNIASGFKRACPDSYGAAGLGKLKIGDHDAFAALIGCGIANPRVKAYSESMLLIVIKGEHDYYTIQWAERSEASTTPIKFDNAKWNGRFKSLIPIKLCSIVPGEAAPYPGCINSK